MSFFGKYHFLQDSNYLILLLFNVHQENIRYKFVINLIIPFLGFHSSLIPSRQKSRLLITSEICNCDQRERKKAEIILSVLTS